METLKEVDLLKQNKEILQIDRDIKTIMKFRRVFSVEQIASSVIYFSLLLLSFCLWFFADWHFLIFFITFIFGALYVTVFLECAIDSYTKLKPYLFEKIMLESFYYKKTALIINKIYGKTHYEKEFFDMILKQLIEEKVEILEKQI